MNKQEAIEKIKDLYRFIMEDGPFEVDLINKNQAIDIISQIDEPQKVTVPKFVAEWIEEIKETTDDLSWIWSVYPAEHKIKKWLEQNTEKFMRAWLDGYEIEKEKLYTVEIPDPHGIYKIRYLYRGSDGNILIGGNDYRDVFLNVKTHLTESEIKQDFDFLWQFAKEVE